MSEKSNKKSNEKSPVMSKLLDSVAEKIWDRTRTESLKNNICVICGGPANKFSDALSKKEYGISGLCQKCQDGVFKEEE